MSITGSCGHVLTDSDGPDGFGWPIEVAGYSRDCSTAVNYMHVCTECRDLYERDRIILNSEKEIRAHLRS